MLGCGQLAERRSPTINYGSSPAIVRAAAATKCGHRQLQQLRQHRLVREPGDAIRVNIPWVPTPNSFISKVRTMMKRNKVECVRACVQCSAASAPLLVS